MRFIFGRNFLKSAELLPASIKRKLAKSLDLLEVNPYHPLLHTKKLMGPLTGLFSLRITREWRTLFYFKDHETILLLEIQKRKDVYR